MGQPYYYQPYSADEGQPYTYQQYSRGYSYPEDDGIPSAPPGQIMTATERAARRARRQVLPPRSRAFRATLPAGAPRRPPPAGSGTIRALTANHRGP